MPRHTLVQISYVSLLALQLAHVGTAYDTSHAQLAETVLSGNP